MTDLDQVIKIGLAIIKDNPNSYYEPLNAELKVLGLAFSDEVLYAAGAIIREHKTLKNAKSVIKDLNPQQVETLGRQEQIRLSEYEKRLKKEAQGKSEREAFVSELSKAFAPLIDYALVATPNSGFGDYTVIARMGDDVIRLRYPVKEALGDGWIPQGGIHIAGPVNGKLLFSQAMVFPSGSKPKKYDY